MRAAVTGKYVMTETSVMTENDVMTGLVPVIHAVEPGQVSSRVPYIGPACWRHPAGGHRVDRRVKPGDDRVAGDGGLAGRDGGFAGGVGVAGGVGGLGQAA